MLGHGGFGVTYLAHDTNLDRQVAIKEYLPSTIAARDGDNSVRPLSANRQDDFDWGLGNFLAEARTLARFRHENIVGVHSVFEENHTAYMVMAYEQGDSLSSLYRRGEYRDQASLERVFFPIFDGLAEIHRLGFVHRDIKPANIYIRADGTAVLLDFGAARLMQQQQTGEMTSLVSQGYTPLEQYSASYGEQGPWTDIYALAATMYEGVTGMKPEESLSRSACLLRRRPDPIAAITSSAYQGFGATFLDAVTTGLALQPEERPQDLDTWVAHFSGRGEAKPASNLLSDFDDLDEPTRLQPRAPFADEDRTRVRMPAPPLLADKPNAPDARPDPSSAIPISESRGTGLRTSGPAVSERSSSGLSDFTDIDDLAPPTYRVASPKAGKRTAARTAPRGGRAERDGAGRTGRGGAVKALFAMLLLAALGGGAWWYYDVSSRGASVAMPHAALIDTLPAPVAPLAIATLDVEVSRRLDTMGQLAALYRQAGAAGVDDEALASGARALRKELGEIALDWHPDRHSGIVGRIERAVALLPVNVADRAELQTTIASADARSDLVAARALLDANAIVEPAGSALIDRVSRLGAEDYRELADTAAWSNMMAELGNGALERVRASDFDGASLLVRAGLTLQPDNPFMQRLGEHLGGG